MNATELKLETHRPAGARLAEILRGRGMLVVLIAVIVFFASQSAFFLTTRNLLNLSSVSAILGLMALTQTFLMISGGIDISIGANAAFTGVMLGRVVDMTGNVWLAVLVALLLGMGIGLFNGLVTVRFKVDPLVVSLGSFSIFTGLAFVFAERTTLIISSASFSFLGTGRILNVPVPFILFAIAFAVAYVIQNYTGLGRSFYAIGGNLEAARLSGIPIDRVRIGLYVASGISAATAGILITSQISAASPNIGATYLLSVVTAVILGGASLKGGQGSVVGTLIAVGILGAVQNGFALMQISSFAQNVVLGFLLIGSVMLDQSTRKERT